MSNELSKTLKRKIDAQLRTAGGDYSPTVREGEGGTVYIDDPTTYMTTYLAGKNINISTSGGSRIINAVMNLMAGSNIEISSPDPLTGQVIITGTISGKQVAADNFIGKDGFVLAYNATTDRFELVEPTGGSGELLQATETELGGVRAALRGPETAEVKIDPISGKLYAPQAGEAQNGIPAGGTTGQILAKVDDSDFNAEWVDAPTGGGAVFNFNPTVESGGGLTQTTYSSSTYPRIVGTIDLYRPIKLYSVTADIKDAGMYSISIAGVVRATRTFATGDILGVEFILTEPLILSPARYEVVIEADAPKRFYYASVTDGYGGTFYSQLAPVIFGSTTLGSNNYAPIRIKAYTGEWR